MHVYRIQPINAELHAIQTTTSNDELAGGVHVFPTLEEVYGCREWCEEFLEGRELVTIECDKRDLKPNGDYEGVTLKAGRGEIVARREVGDAEEFIRWIENTCWPK